MSADQRRQALRAYMESRGLNPSAWSTKAGTPRTNLRQFLNGTTDSLSLSTLEKLAKAEGVSVAELIGQTNANVATRGSAIRFLSWHIDEGGKMIVEPESGGAPLRFPSSWVDHYLGGRSDLGRIYDVPGDPFAKELRSGDVVCVHLGRTDAARDPGIYLLFDGEMLHLRRPQLLPGRVVRLLSDNPSYEATDISADKVQFIGRVVWRAGAL